MKRVAFQFCILATLLLSCVGCGYHVGGLKNPAMKDMRAFCVNMFENYSTYPQAAQLMTTALADSMQRDGSFRLASTSECDFSISGKVTNVGLSSLRTDPDDTYLSTEIGLTVYVDYEITDRKTGKVVMRGHVTEQGSYFNEIGNVQSARDAALSYATRKAASDIVNNLTLP